MEYGEKFAVMCSKGVSKNFAVRFTGRAVSLEQQRAMNAPEGVNSLLPFFQGSHV